MFLRVLPDFSQKSSFLYRKVAGINAMPKKPLSISCLCSCIATDSDKTNRQILSGKAVRLGKKEIVSGWPLSTLKIFKNRIEVDINRPPKCKILLNWSKIKSFKKLRFSRLPIVFQIHHSSKKYPKSIWIEFAVKGLYKKISELAQQHKLPVKIHGAH